MSDCIKTRPIINYPPINCLRTRSSLYPAVPHTPHHFTIFYKPSPHKKLSHSNAFARLRFSHRSRTISHHCPEHFAFTITTTPSWSQSSLRTYSSPSCPANVNRIAIANPAHPRQVNHLPRAPTLSLTLRKEKKSTGPPLLRVPRNRIACTAPTSLG